MSRGELKYVLMRTVVCQDENWGMSDVEMGYGR